MKRLHLHVAVKNLPDAIKFYSILLDTEPCCGGDSYANWRVSEPPLNLGDSVTRQPFGLAHMGLEVDDSKQLTAVDRVLQGPLRTESALPWEVSVRKQAIRKECRS
jgi:hypothetical protein